MLLYLIDGGTVLFHLNNVGAGGQTADGNGAVGCSADTAGSEAAEGLKLLEEQLNKIGYKISYLRGDYNYV